MEKLHVRLQGCMLQLQEQLLADLAAKQAAAAAEEQVGSQSLPCISHDNGSQVADSAADLPILLMHDTARPTTAL
jgi:hypothetical protein